MRKITWWNRLNRFFRPSPVTRNVRPIASCRLSHRHWWRRSSWWCLEWSARSACLEKGLKNIQKRCFKRWLKSKPTSLQCPSGKSIILFQHKLNLAAGVCPSHLEKRHPEIRFDSWFIEWEKKHHLQILKQTQGKVHKETSEQKWSQAGAFKKSDTKPLRADSHSLPRSQALMAVLKPWSEIWLRCFFFFFFYANSNNIREKHRQTP